MLDTEQKQVHTHMAEDGENPAPAPTILPGESPGQFFNSL
jgi:hypothetical protein